MYIRIFKLLLFNNNGMTFVKIGYDIMILEFVTDTTLPLQIPIYETSTQIYKF